MPREPARHQRAIKFPDRGRIGCRNRAASPRSCSTGAAVDRYSTRSPKCDGVAARLSLARNRMYQQVSIIHQKCKQFCARLRRFGEKFAIPEGEVLKLHPKETFRRSFCSRPGRNSTTLRAQLSYSPLRSTLLRFTGVICQKPWGSVKGCPNVPTRSAPRIEIAHPAVAQSRFGLGECQCDRNHCLRQTNQPLSCKEGTDLPGGHPSGIDEILSDYARRRRPTVHPVSSVTNCLRNDPCRRLERNAAAIVFRPPPARPPS